MLLAGTNMWHGRTGRHAGFVAPTVAAVLPSGWALHHDAGATLWRGGVDWVERPADARSVEGVVAFSVSDDGAFVATLEHVASNRVRAVIRSAKTLESRVSSAVFELSSDAPAWVVWRDGELSVLGTQAASNGHEEVRVHRAFRIAGEDTLVSLRPQVIDGQLLDVVVGPNHIPRVLLRRGDALFVEDVPGGPRLLTMSAGGVGAAVLNERGTHVAWSRQRLDGRAEVSLVTLATGTEAASTWRGTFEAGQPSLAMSPGGDGLFVAGETLVRVEAGATDDEGWIPSTRTLSGDWRSQAIPRAEDLAQSRSYRSVRTGATVTDLRWSNASVGASDDLAAWAEAVIGMTTGLSPVALEDPGVAFEAWSDRLGQWHASARHVRPREGAAQTRVVHVVSGDVALQASVLEFDGIEAASASSDARDERIAGMTPFIP